MLWSAYMALGVVLVKIFFLLWQRRKEKNGIWWKINGSPILCFLPLLPYGSMYTYSGKETATVCDKHIKAILWGCTVQRKIEAGIGKESALQKNNIIPPHQKTQAANLQRHLQELNSISVKALGAPSCTQPDCAAHYRNTKCANSLVLCTGQPLCICSLLQERKCCALIFKTDNSLGFTPFKYII